MKFKSLASLLLLALVAAGCGRCSSGVRGKSAEEFVAVDSVFVASVPSLSVLAKQMTALSDNLRSGPAGQKLVQGMADIARQVGFDPFSEAGMKSAGLDPSRSLAAGSTGGGRQGLLLAVPFADKTKATETVTRLVMNRTGAKTTETRDVNGVKVTVLVQQAGGEAQLAYADKDGFLLLGAGEGAVEGVAAAMTRTAEQSIAQSAAYADSKKKIGAREVYLMLAQGGGALQMMGLQQSTMLGLAVTSDELAVRAYVELADEQAKAVKAALSGGGKTLLPLLPEASPLYVRGGLNLAAILAHYQKVPDSAANLALLSALAAKAGFDLENELLSNIEPGFALSVGISQTAQLASAFDFNPRRSNPFNTYTMLGLGTVKDAAKAQATLAKIPELADALDVRISEREVAGTKVWTANYRHGEGLVWALVGKRIVIAGGLGDTFDSMVASLAKGTQNVKPEAFSMRTRQALFTDAGVAFALDLGRVNALVNGLPTSAFGPGASGMMARSVANTVIAPLSRFRGLVAITPTEGGVLLDLSAQAQPAGK